jgi:hypothetical protein
VVVGRSGRGGRSSHGGTKPTSSQARRVMEGEREREIGIFALKLLVYLFSGFAS